MKLKVGKWGWWDQPLLTSVTAVIAGATASKFKSLLTHAASSHLLVRFCLRSHCKWRQSLLIIDDKLAVETQAPSWALHMTLLQSRVSGSTIWWLKAASLRVIHVPRVQSTEIISSFRSLLCLVHGQSLWNVRGTFNTIAIDMYFEVVAFNFKAAIGIHICSQALITPYAGNLSAEEEIFNR